MLMELDEESARAFRFKRIFPENVTYYCQFFENQRYNNILAWKWVQAGHNAKISIIQRILSALDRDL